jgi:thiamine-phosphate pyrophosphorylase
VCLLLPIRKPLLCYVTDRRSLSDRPAKGATLLLEKIGQAAGAGVDWIQLREKDLSGRELADLCAQALKRLGGMCKLIVNDRLDAAIAYRAAGVHLGEQGLPLREAKRLASRQSNDYQLIVGASVHSLESAREAENSGADYLIFGPVFRTPSKVSFGAPQGIARLGEICGIAKIPVLAIGGITAENSWDCLKAGASGIAAIRLFQEAENLPDLVSRLRRVSSNL